MCECCVVDELNYGDILPNIVLMKARRNGAIMKSGQYGLVYSNDPFIIFDIPEGTEISLKDDTKGFINFEYNVVVPFRQKCKCSPEEGHILYKSALEAGYNPEVDGYNFEMWLMERIINFLNEHNRRNCKTV